MILYMDSLGLNSTQLQGMPIAGDVADIARHCAAAPSVLSLMGSRHSQGGHTVAQGAFAVLTEPMNRITLERVDGVVRSVEVQAGVTWNTLHAYLAPEGCAPLVQQSSSHFTVGGSISVNCHGRDPRQGPLSTCIEALQVFRPTQKKTVWTQPGETLFKAVVGGYGSAGVILTAKLRVGTNRLLKQNTRCLSLSEYAQEIQAWQQNSRWPALHYGWLCFDPNRLFKEVLVVDCTEVPGQIAPVREAADQLSQESWASIETMRWFWEEHQENPLGRTTTWGLLCNWFASQDLANDGQGKQQTHVEWLRQPIGFTAHRSPQSVDLLQEYFVPLAQLDPFVRALAQLLTDKRVNVLSSTVRVVQPDQLSGSSKPLTFLSYAPDMAMACVALDFECPVRADAQGHLAPVDQVYVWVQQAIDLANHYGGRYYLPYYGFASLLQFQRAYPRWAQQNAQSDSKLANLFLEQYLA